ncbi:hypothetical protein VC77_08485 [Vibrio cholerae]|nr:hypothetical protein VC77_08485 [Vibrio cholerae]
MIIHPKAIAIHATLPHAQFQPDKQKDYPRLFHLGAAPLVNDSLFQQRPALIAQHQGLPQHFFRL